MKLVEFSTRRPVSVFIFAVAAVVFGIIALRQLATDLLPDISYPSVTIRTQFDGAAPAEVESLVTRPVENAVGVVNGVVRVSSSSRTDVSEVTLEFGWDTSIDMASLDVRERLDLLQLPADAERPVLLRYDPSLDPILRIGVHGEDDLVRLRLIAEEDVQRALERIEGVAGVVISGGLEEEIQVEIDERRLGNFGLSLDQVLNRLTQENVNLTGGRLLEGQTEYLVRTVNEFVRAEELERIVVDSSLGSVTRLEDVGTVFRGHREREIITRINRAESVEVAIYKEGGTNTVTVSDSVQASLDALRDRLKKLNPELELTVITDQASYIRESVGQVMQTAIYGGALAILVLFLFLRSWKPTLIIGVAIPISVIATFFLMYASNISLNIMSLGGLTLGIGLLVDNSIVVLESIQRRRSEGMDETSAANRGASEVGRAVVASTLTTICVFVPIVFVEGVAGQLFGDQAITVTFSLLVSLLVALTVIPMLASRRFRVATEPAAAARPADAPGGFLRRMLFELLVRVGRAIKLLGRGVVTPFGWLLRWPLMLFGAGIETLRRVYVRQLGWVLRHPWITIGFSLLLLAASLALFPLLGRELIPELVQGEFYADIQLPPGTHLDVTQRRMAALENSASRIEGVTTVYALVGASNEQGGVAGERRENLAQLTLRIAPPITREREEAVMLQMRTAFDQQEQLDYNFGRPAYFSFKTPIEIEIRGYNLVLLDRISAGLVDQLSEVRGLADVKSSTEGGSPELQIRFDRNRLAALGLNLSEVAGVVRSKIQGTVATDIQREDRKIDIRLRASAEFRDSVDDLASLTVLQRGKTSIPLSALAEITEVEGPAEIRRSDGDRVAVITANLQGRDLASVTEEIEGLLEQTRFPPGINWRVAGQRKEMETSFNSMRLAILLAVFMVYLVMASQFESLLHPFVILFSVPFSVIGVLVTLFLFNVAVSIVVLIGVILLAGIVVNNGIILVDFTNQLRRAGADKISALTEAGSVRLRPILMTTSTTCLGLLPMSIGLGAGGELRAPMALTVIGGLLASTFLTLLIIPAVYSIVDRRP